MCAAPHRRLQRCSPVLRSGGGGCSAPWSPSCLLQRLLLLYQQPLPPPPGRGSAPCPLRFLLPVRRGTKVARTALSPSQRQPPEGARGQRAEGAELSGGRVRRCTGKALTAEGACGGGVPRRSSSQGRGEPFPPLCLWCSEKGLCVMGSSNTTNHPASCTRARAPECRAEKRQHTGWTGTRPPAPLAPVPSRQRTLLLKEAQKSTHRNGRRAVPENETNTIRRQRLHQPV
ncbi:hypothetical protein NDU88_001214 [Pleurodeles waltl]|uniref:Uncharacterized protein n=1 Tax=Pleurodeles waltl TaxID=8319 RepID=A0AAV7VVU2_PLEWA|nr:hypothetical protein NDU88_001214 [Pleurodeles waltl]